MTEVTRVPLRPIEKGSLAKLWIGVAIAVLLGAGLAWAAMPKGLNVETLVEGSGPSPQVGDVAFVRYVGKLASTGEIFDESQDIPIPVQGLFPQGTPFPVEEGATIPGFFQGLQQMQKGGKYELYIPADQGYGAEEKSNPQTGEVVIPANSDLIFEVELVDFLSKDTFDRNLQILQQSLGGAMGGPPGAAPPGEGAPEETPPPAPQPAPGE